MVLLRKNGLLSEEDEAEVQGPLRKFKSIFPNASMAKHTPLDIILMPPSPETAPGQRQLVVRDMGSVESDILSREFILAYFEGDGISRPVRLF
jgi:hypothetical protein